MTLEQVFGVARHVLTIVGVILIMTGSSVEDSQWQMLSGAVLSLGALVWSIFSKTPPTNPTA